MSSKYAFEHLSSSVSLGVIQKVRMLRFRNFRPPLPFTCTYAFSLDPLCPEYERTDIIFKRRHDRDIFCELLSIKEPETVLQNKETTLQIYRKMSNQNIKRSPRIRFALCRCTREMGMDNFGYLNSSLYFISVFKGTCKKNLWRTYAYSRTFPSPHTSQCAFSWTTPFPPSERMYFMDDPLQFFHEHF